MAYTNKQFLEDYTNTIKILKKTKNIDENAILEYIKKIPSVGKIVSASICDDAYATYEHNSRRIYFSKNIIQDIQELILLGYNDKRYGVLFRKTAGSIYHEYQHYIDLAKLSYKVMTTKSSFNKAIDTVSPNKDFKGNNLEKTCDYFFSGLEFNAYSVTVATMVSSVIQKNKKTNKPIQVLMNDAITEMNVAGFPLQSILATRPKMEKIFKRKVYSFLHSKLIELSDRSKIIQLKSWIAKSELNIEVKKEFFHELVSKIKDIMFGQDNSAILSKKVYNAMVRANDEWLAKTILGG